MALIPFVIGTVLTQDVINLPANGTVAEICGNVVLDEGQSLFSLVSRLEIYKENLTNTVKCYDCAATILKDDNDQQTILLWMDTDIPTTVTSTTK